MGSAREINSSQPCTSYGTTRWYRAPEVILGSENYSFKADMWAMGATMAELFMFKPLFPGRDSPDQMLNICRVLGSPTTESWLGGFALASGLNYKFPQLPGVNLSSLMPSASWNAISLIKSLCSWDPSKRPSASEALKHPFFHACYNIIPPYLRLRASVNNTATREEFEQIRSSNVRPDAFMLVGHPFGKKLFGEHNLIYMFGQDHKDLRGLIAPNFTPKALSTYTSLQQTIILKHLKNWVNIADSKPMSLRLLVLEMNLQTSQTVFVGPYLDEKVRVEFNGDYNLFNVGLMTLPIDLPGFAFRTARVAVERLVNTLSLCTKQSKAKMVDDQELSCLIDFWMQEIVKYTADGEAAELPQTFDRQIGGYLFDFLFAAQDASTSSLLWSLQIFFFVS